MLAPWIYGLPGDNPMQSELCSHIGMSGNKFCRVCKVSRAPSEGTGKNVRTRTEEELLREYLTVRSSLACLAPTDHRLTRLVPCARKRTRYTS
jgi:hypothetical protein